MLNKINLNSTIVQIYDDLEENLLATIYRELITNNYLL